MSRPKGISTLSIEFEIRIKGLTLGTLNQPLSPSSGIVEPPKGKRTSKKRYHKKTSHSGPICSICECELLDSHENNKPWVCSNCLDEVKCPFCLKERLKCNHVIYEGIPKN